MDTGRGLVVKLARNPKLILSVRMGERWKWLRIASIHLLASSIELWD